MKRLVPIFLLFFALALPVYRVFAQASQNSGFSDTDQVSISLTPQHPQAGDEIGGMLDSTSIDLNRTTISWYVNGALVKQGLGAKGADLGLAGKDKTVVQAVIQFGDAGAEKTVTFDPSAVSIAWQADSYVPPFYKGKALYPPQGRITFVAMTDLRDASGNLIDPSHILYTWSKDGQVLGDMSGTGAQTYSMEGTVITRPSEIQVTAQSLDTGDQGTATLTIASQAPEVDFYEDNPLFGIRTEKALSGTVHLDSPEITLFAAPYFMNSASLPSFQYRWLMNGTALASHGQDITLRSASDISGISLVNLDVLNPDTILQEATGNVYFSYKAADTASVFNTQN